MWIYSGLPVDGEIVNGVVARVLDCGVVVSELELQSRY